MAKSKKEHKCKLLPYKKIDCLSMLDACQKTGWGIDTLELPKAWEKTQGEGVVIGVIDTGCDLDHPDLNENLLEGVNIIDPSKPPEDCSGHGTHTIGILIAENNDIGMVGVCPKAKVVPIKALDCKGNGTLSNVTQAIRWAADRGGIDFLTMSLGSTIRVQQVRKAIQYAASKGIVTFCAAGNAGKTDEVFYPANYPETISIGAIKENFERADFSNTGKNLDFMAPGVDIFSTYTNNWYATLSGTSMACPFAVGIAALVLSYVRKGKLDIKLETADDYRELFKKYTTSVSSIDNGKFYQGYGLIDPRKLLQIS